MRYKIEQYGYLSNHPYADVSIMSDILVQVKAYSEKAGYNHCILIEINDDSVNDTGRLDVEVEHSDIDYSSNTIKATVWQKLFYVDGEVIDCNTYAEKYLAIRRMTV